MKLKHWTQHHKDCRGNPTPEHAARAKEVEAGHKPRSIHPDEKEADLYFESIKNTSDYEDEQAWHGWAIKEAFMAGMTAQRDHERIQKVIRSFLNAEDELALGQARERISALVGERNGFNRRPSSPLKATRIEEALMAAGITLDDSDWREGTWWWFQDRSKATLVPRTFGPQEAA